MYGARSLLQRYSDTLDAHARSDVVNGGKTRRKRKRKEASDQVDQGLIDFLIGSHMASGESKRELADREEAITGINPLSHPDRQLGTVADGLALRWPRGRAVRLRLAGLSPDVLIIIIQKLLH